MSDRRRNGMSAALLRMAEEDPKLATRLLLAGLPAAAREIRETLSYRLVVDGIGAWRVAIHDGAVRVVEDARGGENAPGATGLPEPEFELRADAPTLAGLAAGGSAARALLSGRLHVGGRRLRALALRHFRAPGGIRELARAGVALDADLVFRAIPYVIDPEWTEGHRFVVGYELAADDAGPGGTWYVRVADGRVTVATKEPRRAPDAVVRMTSSTWLALLRGDLTPDRAMQTNATMVEGALPAVTLLGRWLERADGRDDAELERETRQRAVQERRSTWGAGRNGAGPPGANGHHREVPGPEKIGAGPRAAAALLDYGELYALWERQNWSAHELDFTADREHWLATPTVGQQHTMWSLASFYLGEERVAADLAPFVLAAPSGEIEIFLTTQLVDEARHAVFFDRFFAEVMAVEAEDVRGRLAEAEALMAGAWHEVFDDALRGVAGRLLGAPDDPGLFVEAVTIYHMIVEGVLAVTGQAFIIDYLSRHGLYPGFTQGFQRVEQDEHRHIAFGVRFLRDACAAEPAHRDVVERTVAELVPRAAHVFVPPYADDPADFTSYGNHSSEIYGYAYQALRRRMMVIGAEIPPAEELMPGPIAAPGPTEPLVPGAPAVVAPPAT